MTQEESTLSERSRSWRRTLRLSFSYAGMEVQLTGRQDVDMIPPPPTGLAPKKGQTGFWYELRDAKGKQIYVRAVHNPIEYGHEVFSPDPKESIINIPRKEIRGTFELLVPEVPDGATLHLFSSPLEPERAGEPAREISRIDLRRSGRKEVKS